MSAETTARTTFVNVAESEIARLLTSLGIVWEYEPRTFVLDRDAEGNTTRAFTPDFYLPGEDRYIEVTTLRQCLITRKNGKVRDLRARGEDVTLINRQAYTALAEQFGLALPDWA